MKRQLFCLIMDFLSKYDPWFVQKRDVLGRLRLSILEKCTASISKLVYGLHTNAYNEHYKLGESTASKCMKRFVIAICACFESHYLKQPICEDFKC